MTGLAAEQQDVRPRRRRRRAAAVQIPGLPPPPPRVETERPKVEVSPDVLCLAHPDWIYNELTVAGPKAEMLSFRCAAQGAGVVPWRYDYERMEEDWFHWILANRKGSRSDISVEGARILASELREVVWEEHERAISHVGTAKGCLFDLHALIPVPQDIQRLGPDDPVAMSWLWQHWGTTWTLRHVKELPPKRARLPPGHVCFQCGFWSADWSPWPAIAHLRQRFPALRISLEPKYNL